MRFPLLLLAATSALCAQPRPGSLFIDYPREGSVFPPDFAPPRFEWRDPDPSATSWRVSVQFPDGSTATALTAGPPIEIGDLDPRTIGPSNQPPALTAQQAAAHTWRPDPALWQQFRAKALDRPATITIASLHQGREGHSASVRISISKDPVAAPIFFRDVPLMPSPTEKGVIKPLAPKMMPLLKWRLRYVDEPSSRTVLEGMHTCANCHSFSADGRTLGMDLDGSHNDKGLYAIVPVAPRISIRHADVISWKKFRNQMERDKRIGFMSQVSPDGHHVVTATEVQYYVANFKDYRFLQVFYPTRGILAWYDRSTAQVRPLPGADDKRFVHANAVWTPDGRELIFVRAPATEAYPKGRPLAQYAGDPNEVPIQYDLYRIPFNNGAGGTPEPIPGASANGMSNSFPKVSPDGRWIVFVQSSNGQLMRPDGQLYIVPAQGGAVRRMNCNTDRMNSWHSFSPNGRWMVFSSKSRSPYTQLFLTHIDEQGNDSPAILIENATAANRAANIPEFVNIPRDGLLHIDAPAAEFYRLYDLAFELSEQGRAAESAAEWRRALALEPNDAKAHNNLGGVLFRLGKLEEALDHFKSALRADPDLVNARNNLGLVLLQAGQTAQAAAQFRLALETDPDSVEAHVNLGGVHLLEGRHAEAVKHLREALRVEPGRVPVLSNLAWILSACPDPKVRDGAEAVRLAQQAVDLSHAKDLMALDTLAAAYAESARFPEAVAAAEQALRLASSQPDPAAIAAIRARLDLYRAARPFREPR